MKVLGPCLGLTLFLSVESAIAAQDAPTDATRAEVPAVPNAFVKQWGAGQPAPDARAAAVAVSRTAPMTIAPAPAIEASDEMFIGTGDGSNGFWVRP